MSNNDSEVVRSLTTVYGFFFVFMSVIVAGSSAMSGGLTETDVSLMFFFFLILALACAMIGLELLRRLYERGLTGVGKWGLTLLVLFVPVVFVFLVGKAMLSNWILTYSWGSIEVPYAGGTVIAIVILVMIFYMLKKNLI